MSAEEQRARTIAIARGQYKPAKNEPKVWFSSVNSLAQVLSDDNQQLLRTIAEHSPASIAELAEQTGRKSSNLSRTLATLARYGLVALRKESRRTVPEALATRFDVKLGDQRWAHFGAHR
jgi:predicted transcriptional regulator